MIKQYLTNVKIAKFPILVIILMCVLSRLPQLCSPDLLLDPDECIITLMAKYWRSGEDHSLFFWGQNYGFSFVEILFILFFSFFLGFTTLSVKLAMLSMWTLGVVFLYKTLLEIFGKENKMYPLLITILFISLPAWAVWSMKARGGYLTSYTAGFIVTYLLFYDNKSHHFLKWLLIGFLLQIVFQSQLFWLIGLFPLMCFFLFGAVFWKKLLGITLGASLLGIPLFFYKKSVDIIYNAPIILPNFEDWKMYLKRFPGYIFDSLHGHYYFSFYFEPDKASRLVAMITIGFISFLFLKATLSSFAQKKWVLLFLSTIYIFGFFIISTIMVNKEGRYFLPVSCFMVITLALYIREIKRKDLVVAVLIVTILLGFKGLFTFRDNHYCGNKKDSVLTLVNYLKSKGITACFSNDCMLTWQIIFYSSETVAARIPFQADRYPKFHRIVDSVFNNGGSVAIVGLKEYMPKKVTTPIKTLSDFYIIENPTSDEVKSSFP